MRRRLLIIFVAVLLLVLLLAGWLALASRDDPGPPARTGAFSTEQQRSRGAYLALAGDCMACHTARGGAPYAGGRLLATPFGSLHTPNITPDRQYGIGNWSADDFWRALHNGVSKDGRLLYPAFPYTNYTRMPREDSDALYVYLQSLPAVNRASLPHQLRFPYNQQLMLAGWRALYFRPGVFRPDAGKAVEWNRGAYLVQGPAHCSACHSPRNWLGASDGESLAGGLIPMQGWYAPALNAAHEAGVQHWPVERIVQLLQTGVSAEASVSGPMAEVVRRSLQHLSDADLRAMAQYLQSLPPGAAQRSAAADTGVVLPAFLAAGEKLYRQHCADCHGSSGQGQAPAYPALAGNRGLTLAQTVNPIRMVLNGGFAPATAGNPRPYSMPPFGPVLSDLEVAQILTYVRSSWGNQAEPVSASEVNQYRSVPLD
ncbi:c-type cytochrome [Pseudoduganella danionis]|uniref:C-type cytochrome n=1 Tax=Pseudoduganella danionis TaxID=1890295 RepID=A0ABW9SNK5_9BURK|nr:cytochrome c [Pseudoduganella danionis]MTW32262.1 c-type cytochrome [Pseudoduganella danionis]